MVENPSLLAALAELSEENLPDGLLVNNVVVRVGLQGGGQIDALRHVGECQQLLPFFAATREINVDLFTFVTWACGNCPTGGVEEQWPVSIVLTCSSNLRLIRETCRPLFFL